MRILHIYKDYFPVIGGIENHVRLLAEAQAARGHDVCVLVTSLDGRTLHERMNGVGIIKAGRLMTIASTPISAALPLELRRISPDIAHLHFPYPVGELSQLFFGKARRVIITYHSDIIKQRGILRFYRPFLQKILRRADRIIATSGTYRESSPFLKNLKHQCTVVPLGIRLEPYLNPDPAAVAGIRNQYGAPLLLFVGRLRYYKGLQYLIRAMERIPAKLLVAGGGPMQQEWRSLTASLGLEDRILFLGEVEDGMLPALYHAADIFVLPACERSEAFGLVQIEAMASGTPVICTELGTGTSFVNRHAETGMVVEPKNPAALGDAVLALFHDEELRRTMGRNGKKRAVDLFSLETMTDSVLQIYREVIGH
jgi:rhamnosyl/mannosyltransferase